MKKLLIGFAALPFIAGVAMAGQSMPLSEAQMDKVTAGGGPSLEIEIVAPSPGAGTEINFGPIQFNVEGPGHVEDPANALGGRVCNTSCTWFNT
jgi:hypothetical protein